MTKAGNLAAGVSEARHPKTAKKETAVAAKEAVKGAAQGAAGGWAGMAAGALKGLGKATLKSKRGRKAIYAVAGTVAIVPLMVVLAFNSVVGVLAPLAEEQAGQHESAQTVATDLDIDRREQLDFGSATDGTQVPWQVLAALSTEGASAARPGGIADIDPPEDMDCPDTGHVAEDGLSSDALLVLRCGAEAFPEVTTWHGVGDRTNNPDSDHPTGHAVDAMIPGWSTRAGNELGWQMVNWYTQHAETFNINYVLWDAQQWTAGSGQWTDYSHPSGGSDPTLDHSDHIHVSVNRGGSFGGGGANAGGSGGPGGGLGPYSLNEDAGLPPEQAEDPEVASRFVAKLLDDELQSHQGVHGLGIGTGAVRLDNHERTLAVHPEDATGADREYISADDALASQGVKESYVAAIAELPVQGMDEQRAEQVFDLARNWYLGLNADISSGGGQCTVAGDGNLTGLEVAGRDGSGTLTLDATQVANAVKIVGAGHDMGISQQGLIISLMTALQESVLRNLANDGSDTRLSAADRDAVIESLNLANDGVGSDWDSVGLFQQRPSMGWGSVEEIMDPHFSATTFFERLLDVDSWEDMGPGQAAQAVQISAFPHAYDQWESAASDIVGNVDGATCASPEFSAEGWTHPIPSGTWTSGFGPRYHPIFEVHMNHNGTDWAAPVGTPVLAAQDGVVVAARGADTADMDPDYWVSGYVVAIDHGNGVHTSYNHLVDSTTVTLGQEVYAGDEIGQVGVSGNTTGAHLHFQVLTGSHEFVDPEAFLPGVGVPTRR